MTLTKIEIGSLDTPLGRLEVAVHEGALVVLRFDVDWGVGGGDDLGRRFPEAELEPADDPAGMVSVLAAYFDGDVRAIDGVVVDVEGTPFQEAVWKATREVPAGETATYGDIANVIGAPRAMRAVGSALGRNPVGIVVPCHRIVPASGGIGKYGGGEHRKAWFLAHEAAHA